MLSMINMFPSEYQGNRLLHHSSRAYVQEVTSNTKANLRVQKNRGEYTMKLLTTVFFSFALMSACSSRLSNLLELPVNHETHYFETASIFDTSDELKYCSTRTQTSEDYLNTSSLNTWQEAYSKLLRNYAELLPNPDSLETGWHFALHDINRDGVPELFLSMLYDNGHVRYRSVYTFTDGILLSLAFEDFAIDGCLFSLSSESPYIISFRDVGFGAYYMRMLISNDEIVVDYYGYSRPNQNALENYWDSFNMQDYNPDLMYFYVVSDNHTDFTSFENLVDLHTFQYVFGRRDDRVRIIMHEISYNLSSKSIADINEIIEKSIITHVEDHSEKNVFEKPDIEIDISPCDIEQQRIMLRYPHVSYEQNFITLDNGTLVDTRLFEAWTVHNPRERNFQKEDLEYIFELIIKHVYAINAGSRIIDVHTANEGDELLMHSTTIAQDGSDSNRFHPAIDDFVEKHKNTSLFVERIVLSSAGFGIRVIVSNYAGEEFHIWPLLYEHYPYSWRVNRYFNHVGEQYWVPEHEHLWKYVEPFHVDIQGWTVDILGNRYRYME